MVLDKEGLHFVLVHGACHGAWCWYKTVDLLQKAGYDVSTVDLLSSGIDCTDPNTISCDQYAQPLLDLLSSFPDEKKVILVAHSLGGVSITRALERCHSKIKGAVYIATIMLPSGVEGTKVAHEFSKLAGDLQERRTYFFKNETSANPTSFAMPKELLLERFYPNCPSQDVVLALSLVKPCPMPKLEEMSIELTPERHGSIPRFYIKTGMDKAITPEAQDLMISKCPPCQKVFVMEGSDHSPFFSAPHELHEHLVSIASLLTDST